MTRREILTELWAKSLGIPLTEAARKLAAWEQESPPPEDLDQEVTMTEERVIRNGFWGIVSTVEGQ